VSAYNLAVSAVTVANAVSTSGQAHVVTIAVSDTAANLSGTNLDTLQTLAASGKLTGVTVTNNTVAVSITLAQQTSDATVIGLFTGTYSFSISGVSVANEASVLAEAHIASVSISDTAANVNAAIDTLQGLGTKLVAIVLPTAARRRSPSRARSLPPTQQRSARLRVPMTFRCPACSRPMFRLSEGTRM
jgi:hypothetical protein